jgi:hypothetical protein
MKKKHDIINPFIKPSMDVLRSIKMTRGMVEAIPWRNGCCDRCVLNLVCPGEGGTKCMPDERRDSQRIFWVVKQKIIRKMLREKGNTNV